MLELDALHYKNHSALQYSQAGELLKLVSIRNDSSILDVGCGYGNIIAELAAMVPNGRAIGIDPSQCMISLAKATFSGDQYHNLNFININAEQMCFPEQVFDIIMCTNVLMWVRKPKKALELMCSSLKPGGKLIIFTYPKSTPYAKLFKKVVDNFSPELKNQSAAKTMLPPFAHKEILIKNGLEISLFNISDLEFTYENEEEFKNYIRGWLGCYIPISNEFQELFLEKICEQAFEDGYYSHTGKISIPHQTLKILARKPYDQ